MLDLLYKRRSIRKYTDKTVSEADRDKIIQAMLLSPSGKNKKPWRFVIIEDKALIEQTVAAKAHGTNALKTASLAVVVIGLTDISDVWIEDCSIASLLIQLEAESLGLGSCWIQIRNRKTADEKSSADYMRGLLKLSESETVESIIAIGHPAESLPARTKEELDLTKISKI